MRTRNFRPGSSGHPEKRELVLIDPNTLEVLHRERLNRGQRWRVWVRFIYPGEAGGWWGETVAALTACGAVLLSFTGLVLFFNRLQRWRVAPPTATQVPSRSRYKKPRRHGMMRRSRSFENRSKKLSSVAW